VSVGLLSPGAEIPQASDQLKAMKESILKQKERLTPLPPEKAKDK